MAIPVEMPKMSDTMEEGVLVAWLADEGAAVSAGDVIAQVETDKATMDLEVYDNGVLLKRMVEEGASVPIGALIAVLGKEGEDVSALLAKYNGNGSAPAKSAPEDVQEEEEKEGEEEAPADPAPATSGDAGRVKASPLARKMADSHGIDLADIRGSGPEGRIVRRDIEAMVSSDQAEAPRERPAERPSAPTPSAAPPAGDAYEAVKISQMRKAISRRLSESKFTSPHFYLTVDVAMENATAFRAQLNELAAAQDRARVSFNDLISKACALALRQHPYVNASYLEKEGEIRLHTNAHIAVAVAIDDGLITPVIRNVDQKGLAQIAQETRDLAERARDRKLQPDEFEGSTFTTSNLGMFGIEEFTAIINPPNACILAIGAIRDEAVVKNGEVVAGKRMKLTLSCDHRVVDGATGSQFLGTVKTYLEEPMNLLL